MSRVPRWTAAALLVVTGLVHLNLYAREQYHDIPTVGWLFLLTVISAAVLAASLIAVPGRLVDVSAVLFSLGVLAGYFLTLGLPHGLCGFKEPGVSYSGAVSIAAEVGVVVTLSFSLWRVSRAAAMVSRPAARQDVAT